MPEFARWEMHWSEVSVFDRNAIALGIDEWELMNSAANELVKEITKSSIGKDVLFICGPGNNGGDGFVASKRLLQLGWNVGILASHEYSKTKISSKARSEIDDKIIHVWPKVPDHEYSLIIDCLLGAGSSGYGIPLRSPINEIVSWIKSKSIPILSCDIPTGLGGKNALIPVKTLTFHSSKKFLNSSEVGEIIVAPLPWPREVEDCGIGDILRYPKISKNARKGDRGRCLVIGGGPYHGAPILAGMAAARSGCDLVSVAMPTNASNRVNWPNSLIPIQLPDSDFLTNSSYDKIVDYILSNSIDSVVIGPGLGKNENTIDTCRKLLNFVANNKIQTVVDADAISALPPETWPDGMLGVATPHKSEAKGWLSDTTASQALSNTVEEEAVIIVTGPVDELTGPEGRYCYAKGGNPRMAVGGTGDLLAGLIGGLMAQGMKPWPAARLGCSLLREAGTKESENSGPGMIADDIIPQIARTITEWLD